MNSKTLVIILLCVIVLVLGAGAAGFWWLQQQGANHGKAAPVAEAQQEEKKPSRFISQEKIIVMLKGDTPDTQHYMSVDLVFRSNDELLPQAKEQLPYMKSIAVRALSRLTREQATVMTVDDFQLLLMQSYTNTYRKEQATRPFSEVLVSKLIVE